MTTGRAPTTVDTVVRALDADLPAGDEKAALVRTMFDSIAPRYDLVNRLMTFGLDVGWRKQSVRALALPAGSVVLDLACGTGDFLKILTRAGLRPRSRRRLPVVCPPSDIRRPHRCSQTGTDPTSHSSAAAQIPAAHTTAVVWSTLRRTPTTASTGHTLVSTTSKPSTAPDARG